jgi:ankyrin repeat protein
VRIPAPPEPQLTDEVKALHNAARSGNYKLIESIVRLGGNLNARDTNGQTALMIAAKGGHIAAVTTLARLGADVNAKDNDGKTALKLVIGTLIVHQ